MAHATNTNQTRVNMVGKIKRIKSNRTTKKSNEYVHCEYLHSKI